MLIAELFLNPSRDHSWKHHPERHKTGADGIVRGFVLAVREVNQIEHIRREAKSIAELLNGDGDVYPQKVFGLRHR